MEKKFSCGLCGAKWQKHGLTNCWSADPDKRPEAPAYCPANDHTGLIDEAFAEYKGDSEDARMSRVATKVEGMCYQPIPGSDAVNARWTRVEDTVAFAKLMGYSKIGIATCIGLLDETNRLALILKAQGLLLLS